MKFAYLLAAGLCLFILPQYSYADMVIFQNGERRFGDALIISGSDVILNQGSSSKRFAKHQIKDIIFGFTEEDYRARMIGSATAADVDLDSVTEVYVPYEASGQIYDITGANVYRKKMTTPLGASFIVDVEEHFDVGEIQIFPIAVPFFGRSGTFVRMSLLNRDTDPWNALKMRVFLFGENGLLQTRDEYIFSLPGNTENSVGRRILEMQFPDVPYAAVKTVRVVRRF